MEALEEKLALEDQVAAIEESAGCWSEEDHPELRADEDIDCWLAELRRSWDQHLTEIGIIHGEEG